MKRTAIGWALFLLLPLAFSAWDALVAACAHRPPGVLDALGPRTLLIAPLQGATGLYAGVTFPFGDL